MAKKIDEKAEQYALVKSELEKRTAEVEALKSRNAELEANNIRLNLQLELAQKQPPAPTPSNNEARDSAIEKEFRDLTRDVSGAYSQLNALIKWAGPFAGTMMNLLSLLRSSFPIKFTEEDQKQLKDTLHNIASEELKEIQQAGSGYIEEIKKNQKRISLTVNTFWWMIYIMMLLAMHFGSVVTLNIQMIHLDRLADISWFLGLGIFIPTIIWIFYKLKK